MESCNELQLSSLSRAGGPLSCSRLLSWPRGLLCTDIFRSVTKMNLQPTLPLCFGQTNYLPCFLTETFRGRKSMLPWASPLAPRIFPLRAPRQTAARPCPSHHDAPTDFATKLVCPRRLCQINFGVMIGRISGLLAQNGITLWSHVCVPPRSSLVSLARNEGTHTCNHRVIPFPSE
mgnify:CR=1 FL=1